MGDPMYIAFHGRLADLFGREIDLPVDGPCTVAELKTRLAAGRPEAAELVENRRVRACVGDALVADSRIVAPGDSVEFLAPVSGG